MDNFHPFNIDILNAFPFNDLITQENRKLIKIRIYPLSSFNLRSKSIVLLKCLPTFIKVFVNSSNRSRPDSKMFFKKLSRSSFSKIFKFSMNSLSNCGRLIFIPSLSGRSTFLPRKESGLINADYRTIWKNPRGVKNYGCGIFPATNTIVKNSEK